MEPLENNETSTTYLTTSKMYVAPVGTKIEDMNPEDWVEMNSALVDGFETFSTALDDLGEAAATAMTKISDSFSTTFIVHNTSVGFIALMFGVSKMDARRIMGYIPRKPLFHNGKKAR